MTVEERNVGNYEELFHIVPEARYIKSAMTLNKTFYRYSSDNNNLCGTEFPNNLMAKFTIPCSDNTLVNLSECYFDISGILKLYKGGTPMTADANGSVFNQYKSVKQCAKVGENWIFNCINKINLYIGGALVYSISTPMSLSKFIKMHYKNDHSVKNGEETLHGYMALTKPAVIEPFITVQTITSDEHDNSVICYSGIKGSELFSFQNETYTFTQEYKESKYGPNIDFTYMLKLSDILPGVETLKPIFGQSIVLELLMESDGYNNINIIGCSADPLCDSIKINKFDQFNFMAVTYLLNVDMKEKLKQIYSKQQIEIIDDISYYNLSLTGIASGQQLNVKCPLNLKFESDFVSLQFPQFTSNIGDLQENFNGLKVEMGNFCLHNNNDLRFMNVQQVEIYADSQLIYSKNYATKSINATDDFTNPDLLAVSRKVTDKTANPIQIEGVLTYSFNDAYHLYKECRYCCGRTEEGSVSYNDFLSTCFSLDIPMSAFTHISTQAQLQINLTFGKGMEKSAGEKEVLINSSSLSKNQVMLDQLRVIQKSKVALVFKGIDSCEVKTIEHSFDNEIYISDESKGNEVKA